jgi:hypothetical protein
MPTNEAPACAHLSKRPGEAHERRCVHRRTRIRRLALRVERVAHQARLALARSL